MHACMGWEALWTLISGQYVSFPDCKLNLTNIFNSHYRSVLSAIAVERLRYWYRLNGDSPYLRLLYAIQYGACIVGDSRRTSSLLASTQCMGIRRVYTTEIIY